jgi:hypothetical protein
MGISAIEQGREAPDSSERPSKPEAMNFHIDMRISI